MDQFFFILSKVGWFFVTPSNLILLALLVGIALIFWKRMAKFGKRLAVGGAVAAVLVVILPLGDWLVLSLERRFPAYQPCAEGTGKPIAGIILLGGAISSQQIGGTIREDVGAAVDRIRQTAKLAKDHPDLPVLVSGGQAFPRKGARSEAVATADFLVELGVDLQRMRLETVSRTTSENAKFVAEQGVKGSWLLVTSAFHMPRSVGSFRKAGVDVIAVPTDWQVDDNRPILTINAIDRLGKLDLGVHEYLGLFAYWVTGRTSGPLPGPLKKDECPPAPPEKKPFMPG